MTEPTTRIIDVFDHPTKVEMGGSGRDLLFLHGEADTADWNDIHDALAENFRVHAPLQPGFGGAEIPDWIRDITDVTFHHIDLLRALDLQRPIVVGVSLGGWLAVDLGIHRPDLLGGVVAVGPLGLRADPPMPDLFIKAAPEALAHLADSLDAARVDPMTGDPDAATRLWCDQAAQARLMWTRPYDRRLRRRAHHLRCPSLVIWGQNDRLLPIEHGRRHAELLDAGFEVVSGAAHMATIDAPEAVAALVADFADQIEA